MKASSRKVVYAALVGNALVALTKFTAAALTRSSAMLSEGIHSVVDTGNQALLLYGMHRAKKPPDARFPFGRGKEVYFWSFVVAILIFALGAGISMYEGILHLVHPSHIQKAAVNYVVLALAMLFEGGAWYFAITEFSKAKGRWGYVEAVRRSKDPTMFVVLFEDSAAMLGLAAAFFGVLLSQVTGNPAYDGIASIVIGLILAATAAWLAYETKGLLIGESANQPVVEGIRAMAQSCKGIEHVNEVLTVHMGPNFILVNLSVDFADAVTAVKMESLIAELDRQIKQTYPNVKRVFVEAEARRSRRSDGSPQPPPGSGNRG